MKKYIALTTLSLTTTLAHAQVQNFPDAKYCPARDYKHLSAAELTGLFHSYLMGMKTENEAYWKASVILTKVNPNVENGNLMYAEVARHQTEMAQCANQSGVVTDELKARGAMTSALYNELVDNAQYNKDVADANYRPAGSAQ